MVQGAKPTCIYVKKEKMSKSCTRSQVSAGQLMLCSDQLTAVFALLYAPPFLIKLGMDSRSAMLFLNCTSEGESHSAPRSVWTVCHVVQLLGKSWYPLLCCMWLATLGWPATCRA